MSKKIFNSIIVVSIISMFFSLVSVVLVINSYFDELNIKECKNEYKYILDGLNKNGINYLKNMPKTENRITYIDKTGKVLFDTHRDIKKLENHLERKEIKESIEKEYGISKRVSKSLSTNTFYFAKQLENGDFIRIAVKNYTAVAVVYAIFRPILIIILFIFVISLILADKLTKKIVEPINNYKFDNTLVYEEFSPFLNKIKSQKEDILKARNELVKKEEELQLISESMDEGLIIIDDKLNIKKYNQSAKEIFNLTEKVKYIYMINRDIEFQDLVENALKGEKKQLEFKMNSKVYYILATPVKNIYDKVKSVIFIILDVTEKFKREELRREFTSNVSHELKTPLTIISGYSELLKNGLVKENEDILKFSNIIYNESNRMINLVDDILKLSKIDEEKEVEKNIVFVKDVIKDVLKSLDYYINKKNIEIILELDDIKFLVNYDNFYEILYNIIENAIKYNIEGGKIIIKSKRNILIIKDTGIGIKDNEIDRIFERFYRVDKGRTKYIEGTGLGLSIVKNLAILNNIKIKICSEYGKWTEFQMIQE